LADEDQRARRRAQWDEVREDVNHIVDALGMPIDEGVKEAVTALRVFGFPTVASCEGHFDWGYPYPWVEIRASESLRHQRQRFENLGHRQRMLILLGKFYIGRNVAFDARLSFDPADNAGGFRLQSAGGEVMEILSYEERQEKQQLYRREISEFAAFLKDRFFSEGED